MSFWIRCEAYFSERPHFGPFWIWIREGRILEIRDSRPEESSDPVLDTGESYLLPLLSDTHVHCYMNPWPLDPAQRARPGSGDFEYEVTSGIERLRLALSSGMGLVRDMGDPFGINLEIRNRISRNPRSFPALQVPGPAIHRPKKYGRFLGVKRESLPEILDFIDELAMDKGVDFIKLVTTGIVDFAKKAMNQSPQFTTDELSAVVERASHHGLRVASHCSGEEGIDINLDSGVQFIEHAYFVRPDQIERMRKMDTCWTPTFAPVYQQAVNSECGWDSNTRRSLYQILDDHNASIISARHGGVNILAGTDAGCPGCAIGEGILIEINCLARSIPLAEVIRMVTADNADACGHPEYTGRIRAGDPASFALYSAAPWQDMSRLGNPVRVFHHGEIIDPQDNK